MSPTSAHPSRHDGWRLALASAALITLSARPWYLGAGRVRAVGLAPPVGPAGALPPELLGVGWLALVAFVPLLRALSQERRPLHAAAYLGLVALGPAFVAFEALGPFAPALLPLVAAAAALPFAAAGALIPRLRRLGGSSAVLAAFPLLWLAAEAVFGRSWLLGRFAAPLLAVGVSQAGLPTMQLARYGGVTGVGLAVLVCNALLAAASSGRVRAAGAGLLALTLATAAAAVAAPQPGRVGVRASVERVSPERVPLERVSLERVSVGVVQQALPDAAYAAAAALPGAREALVRAFASATASLAGSAELALTVWPEGALPGPLPAAGTTGLEPYLADLGPVLTGAPARYDEGIANALYAWRDGALLHVYDKRRLAPLTEDRLVPGAGTGTVTVGGLRVGPLICFEVAFTGLARAAARSGAELLVVVTNDAFARRLDVPENHLRLARFRAVETGLPLLFASNAGPSAVIDGAGRVLARTPVDRPAGVAAALELGSSATPFVRWGDWPTTLALVGTALLALMAGALGGAPRP